MAMASGQKLLAPHESRAADLRDKMLQQALAQTGVGDPKTAGRKGPGSGVAAAFSGAWERDAVNRQFGPGAVEQMFSKPASELTKGRKTGLNKDKGLGLGCSQGY
jgi:hypothetical protein